MPRKRLSCSKRRSRSPTVSFLLRTRNYEAFSYSVSHDLRAPLRHIDGFARLLGETYGGEMPQQVRHYLERILAAADHMGHLVDSLLNLARIGRKELIRQEAVCLGDLMQKAVSDFSAETEERAIEWRIHALPAVSCDPTLLSLVFSNLLSNALKFTRGVERPVIQVGTQVAGGRVTILSAIIGWASIPDMPINYLAYSSDCIARRTSKVQA